ncbi:hypothetical protein L1049_019035 [Liquidambar formosana]|uniref:Uncharacterized protein n=1 Tax=Liquidambar formosana TaxID=63359 RepID=A0AAP0RAX3_LIQFO
MLSVFPFRAVWELACFVGTADQLQHISLKMLFGEATLARCHIDGLCEILVVSAENEATWSGAVQTIALQKPQELLDLFSSGNCSASAFAINMFLEPSLN